MRAHVSVAAAEVDLARKAGEAEVARRGAFAASVVSEREARHEASARRLEQAMGEEAVQLAGERDVRWRAEAAVWALRPVVSPWEAREASIKAAQEARQQLALATEARKAAERRAAA